MRSTKFWLTAVLLCAWLAESCCTASSAAGPRPTDAIISRPVEAPISTLVLQLQPIGIEPLRPVGLGQVDRHGSRSFELSRRALACRGTRYVWGGSHRTGFDCSGFTQFVLSKMGVSLPRRACEQFATGQPVEISDLQDGDLVFFNTTGVVSHVGIYIGNGKFVHASSRGGLVRVDSLMAGYYHDRFVGARRMTMPSSG